ncbi:hypothetical protein [Aphanothece hegewaldii]|nr:hypothetical protein [Aphanothece hegewaldii]
MSLIRQRVDKNKVLVDFEKSKPSEVRIDIDHKNVFKGRENDPKLSSSIEPKSLESITSLLNLPDGEEVDLPYKNISIRINDQEVFKYENGQVVLNALAPQVSERSIPTSASKTTKPLTRIEQLDKMANELQGLEIMESLAQIVREKGSIQSILDDEGNQTLIKTLEHENYLMVVADHGFSIQDKNQKVLFHQEIGKFTKNSLSNEDWQKLKTFVKESQQEKENTTHEKEEIEID